MKNKLLLTLLALVCVLCCALSFAACDPANNDNGDNGDAAEITAAQWTQALSALPAANNFTVVMDNETVKLDGDKIQMKMGVTDGYISKEGNTFFLYSKESENAQWTKQAVSHNMFDQSVSGIKDMVSQIATALKDKFTSFTYADGVYSAASLNLGETMGEIKNVKITFNNGAFVSAEFSLSMSNGQGGEMDVTYSLKDVGSTAITLPNVPDPSATTKLTEEEWQQTLEAFAYAQNFTLTLVAGEKQIGFVKLEDATYYDKDGADYENIYDTDGTNYIRYYKENATAKWKKTNSSSTSYNNAVNKNVLSLVIGGTQAFAANYSDFTFANGKYTAETISVTEGFTLKNVEVTVSYGAVTKIVCTQVGTNSDPDTLVTIYDIGATKVIFPADFIDNTNGGNDKPGLVEITNFSFVGKSEKGWAIFPNIGIRLRSDGQCVLYNETVNQNGTYTTEKGVLTLNFGSNTLYAVIEGQTLWLYNDKESAGWPEKSVQQFYNGAEIDKETYAMLVKNFGDGKISSGNKQEGEVTDQLWMETLWDAKNFTFTRTVSDAIITNKVNDDVWQQTDSTGEVNNIVVKEGSSYLMYVQDHETQAWTKSTVSSSDAIYYNLDPSFRWAQYVVATLDDNYGDFQFVDGKYICDELNKEGEIGFSLSNIVVVFEKGQLFYVEYTTSNGEKYVIQNFGSTEIELPQNYTESNE